MGFFIDMDKAELIKARDKINIYECPLKDYAEYLEEFWGKRILIETDDEEIGTIEIILSREQFPHMIGIDYCYDTSKNKSSYVGNAAMDLLETGNISIQNLKKNFNKNKKVPANDIKISWDRHIVPRFEWLPYFLNKLSINKVKMCKNKKDPKHKIQGDYLLFKLGDKNYLILSIKNTNNGYVCETFIVNDGLGYYNPEDEISLKNVCID